jgi:RecA-family ATPase
LPELLHDFVVKEIVTPPYIIGRGILPMSAKLVLGGAPKSNKSFLALNIARDLAMGQNLLDASYKGGAPVFPVKKVTRILYLDQELGQLSMQTRLRMMMGQEPSPDLPMYIRTRDVTMRLDTEEGVVFIRKEIEACQPDVVIFDPLAKFNLSDENSAQEMGAVMRQLDHFVADYGLSTIVIHHTGHPNPQYPRRGGDRLRGSTAIYGDADTIVTVERKSTEAVREPILELNFELRCGEPIEPIFVRRTVMGTVEYLGAEYKSPTATPIPARKGRYGHL